MFLESRRRAGASRKAAGRLDRFLPVFDVRELHEVVIHAPARLVLDTARKLDIGSLAPVRAIFWLRGLALGARRPAAPSGGLVDVTRSLGWGTLEEEEGRYFCAGAICQPWLPEVVFRAVPPADFPAYAEPDRVKIVWTLESEPLGPATTRFVTETRAAATDSRARIKFRRYWRFVGIGVVLIRGLHLRAVRREAERRWRGEESLVAALPG